MKLFLDTEFTALSISANLISIGIVLDNDKTFYAEFSDYKKGVKTGDVEFSPWVVDNVIPKLILQDLLPGTIMIENGCYQVRGDSIIVGKALKEFLLRHQDEKPYEVWADVLAYDWLFLLDLLRSYIPPYELNSLLFYIPFDLATLFRANNLNPDLSRVEMVKKIGKKIGPDDMHNSLIDAQVTKEITLRALKVMGIDPLMKEVGNQTEPD